MKNILTAAGLFCCILMPVMFNCTSDNEAPAVSITSPLDGDTVAVYAPLITAQASDNDAVEYVEFNVDNVLIRTDSAAPFEASWPIAGYSDMSTHSITGTAFDPAGNSAQSDVVLVTVVNRGTVSGAYADTVIVFDGTWALCDVALAAAPDSAVVDSVAVSVSILHNSISDVDVYLQAPSGTEYQLWNNDFAMPSDTVTTAQFAGEDINGTWILRIYDEVNNGLGGYATDFEIRIFWKY